jgi:hypothetical protein
MDNPDKAAIKNGQSRETGNQEWTIQRNWQSRMDNPKKEAIKNGQLVVSVDCPFLIACFSGLSILDCRFLWIVHS